MPGRRSGNKFQVGFGHGRRRGFSQARYSQNIGVANCVTKIVESTEGQMQDSSVNDTTGTVNLDKMMAFIEYDKCNACAQCVAACPFTAISMKSKPIINENICKGCGICIKSCPVGAITIRKV
jgi:heterodisulfide reductase subunit A-like polyferredoxin